MSNVRHVMTSRRKAALRKAQLVSARKRRRKKWSSKRKVATGVSAAVAVGGTAAAIRNPYLISKSPGFSRYAAKNVKLSVPGPGSHFSSQKIPYKSKHLGKVSAGHSRSVGMTKGRDINGRMYSRIQLTGKKVGPLGDSTNYMYNHYALFGSKTKTKTSRYISSDLNRPDLSNNINHKIRMRKTKSEAPGTSKSKIVVTKNFPHYVKQSNHANPLVRRINNEIIGSPVPGLPRKGIQKRNRIYKIKGE